MKRLTLLATLLIFIPFILSAKEINVGLEPFPPLINEDGTGVIIDLFKQLSAHTDLQFNVQLMTYARAKKDLANKKLDLIGLIPKNNETPSFYQYAQELHWSFNTTLDVFSTEKPPVNLKTLSDFSIGTLIGNAEFFSQTLHIPVNKFAEISSLQQLVKMLKKGRISVIIFERMATMTTIKQLQINNIYYQKLASLPASLALQNNADGDALKATLDTLLRKITLDEQHNEIRQYNNLNDMGIVTVNAKNNKAVAN